MRALKKISFLHAADLHIDSPFQGLSTAPKHVFDDILESTYVSLNNLVELAIHKQVDFILLVGDIFDENIQSLKAKVKLRQAFETLQKHDIDVFLSYGNHDYEMTHDEMFSFPGNVHIFPSEEITHFAYYRNGKRLANIYGFSYEERVIKRNKAIDFELVDEEIPFHIAMLHGSLKSNVDHDVYAPFQIRDLQRKHFDYWALGHIHKREILHENPYIVYPGNIQGRHIHESEEKGCYYVVMDEAEVSLDFMPLHAIEFTSMFLDLANCEDLYEAQQKVLEELINIQSKKPQLLQLIIKNDEQLMIERGPELDDFLDVIHEQSLKQKEWQYIYSVKIEEYVVESLAIGEHFIAQLAHEYETIDVHQSVEDLFNHRQGRKFLERLDDEEKEEIKQQAKQMILKSLIGKE